jgi:DNA-binding CsgD family transcriptional regulator
VRVLGQAGASAAAQADHALAVEPAGDQVLGEVLLRAGEEALAAGAPGRAAQLLERSLAEYAMPERPTAVVAVLGGALMRLGSPRAAGLLREALALSPDPPEKTRLTGELIDALWLSGDPEAALALQRENDEGHPPGVRAATAAREGTLPVPDVVSLARKGLAGSTAFERSCALATLIACDELDEAARTLPEHVEVAARKGASAELAVLELLVARLSALADGFPEPTGRFPGPDPGPSPWAAWLTHPREDTLTPPDAVRRFGSVTAHAASWMAVAAGASGAARLDALQRAVGLLRESPRPLALAIALTDLGRTMRQTGSRVAARETLREALERAHRLGAAEVAEQAQAELRIAGARPRRESLSGPDSLTAGERRVVEAAAQGLTNREIAAQLFLSTKTVEMHLSRSYRKLEIASRAELGAALSGLPLPEGTP